VGVPGFVVLGGVVVGEEGGVDCDDVGLNWFEACCEEGLWLDGLYPVDAPPTVDRGYVFRSWRSGFIAASTIMGMALHPIAWRRRVRWRLRQRKDSSLLPQRV